MNYDDCGTFGMYSQINAGTGPKMADHTWARGIHAWYGMEAGSEESSH